MNEFLDEDEAPKLNNNQMKDFYTAFLRKNAKEIINNNDKYVGMGKHILKVCIDIYIEYIYKYICFKQLEFI